MYSMPVTAVWSWFNMILFTLQPHFNPQIQLRFPTAKADLARQQDSRLMSEVEVESEAWLGQRIGMGEDRREKWKCGKMEREEDDRGEMVGSSPAFGEDSKVVVVKQGLGQRVDHRLLGFIAHTLA